MIKQYPNERIEAVLKARAKAKKLSSQKLSAKQAIEISLEKWIALSNLTQEDFFIINSEEFQKIIRKKGIEFFGADSCACCKRWLITKNVFSLEDNCPLAKVGRCDACENTPYYRIVTLFEKTDAKSVKSFIRGAKTIKDKLTKALKAI